ncbi:hypothetical protein MTR_4g044740 [Medicago truncatula]|uniref:Uncharacterized protein n=1 Tax=Medicago truncatula TaxID=3880 RepID=G7ZUF5_MEDTR|nr:hypothetical protein MTR_4g044740 [Medicago truncatula]
MLLHRGTILQISDFKLTLTINLSETTSRGSTKKLFRYEGIDVKKAVHLDRPRTLNEFLAIAKIYIAYEEELYANNLNKSRKDDHTAESSKNHFTEYTPLAMSRQKILVEIAVADLTEAGVKPLKAPSQERKGVDKTK